eukprot:14792156-Ditylum_brightwellii.AAC.1
MQKAALLEKSAFDFEGYKSGATYVPLMVAVSLLENNHGDKINVFLEEENASGEVWRTTKCSKHGADFHPVPVFQMSPSDG